jgi:hypothetical protein
MTEKTIPIPEEVTSIALEGSSKRIVKNAFREIGFNTEMWADKVQETIFFIAPNCKDRLDAVSPEAVAEFIAYWENQIAVAKDYVKNGCNPHTHEWNNATPQAQKVAMPQEARIKVLNGNVIVHSLKPDGQPKMTSVPISDLQGQWKQWDLMTELLRTFDPPVTADEWTVLEVVANTPASRNGLNELRQALARTIKVPPRKESSEKK